ncbi:FISUMP domain-containing protein [Elizabethkingia bruuniana]|uniref:FISUMP domain-containing protein n=1 Tax=Elizabethkingia bruuniana TaxID=1756149 RepID=UPI00241CC607|nr:FISUMP domain-containing protein [Elizabethkingia bruuniana]
MKIKKHNDIYNNYYKPIIILFLFSVLFSCHNTDRDNKLINGTATIKINMLGDDFENNTVLETQASSNNNTSIKGEGVQRKEIPFNKDYTLVAELSPASSGNIPEAYASLNDRTKAVAEINNLKERIRYKVIVFETNGEYVTERDYTRGQESSSEILSLQGGKDYIFIAYSINSTIDLPPVSFSIPSNKTLATSSISAIEGNVDFMYYRKDMGVSGDKPNNLDIIFKHKLSQITATIDASETGYNITKVNANFDSHYPVLDVALASGVLTRSGIPGNISIDFGTPETKTVTANPVVLNTETTTGKLVVSSLTIGQIAQSTSKDVLTGLKIVPGVKYDLKLKIKPTDIYLVHEGISAARINGVIWMRHNLGVDTGIDPDKTPIASNLHGNYYQFGRSAIVANGTETNVNANYNSVAADEKAWNSGTDIAPVKTTNDPCPSGYRVPTTIEFRALRTGIIETQTGTWKEDNTNYSAAKILTSKRNSSVKLTFPAQGYFFYNNPLTQRGMVSHYWSSSKGPDYYSIYLKISENPVASFSWYRQFGFNIRCVAESNKIAAI